MIINFTHPALLNRELRENPRQQEASAYMLLFRTPQGEAMITANGFAWPRQAIFEEARKHGQLAPSSTIEGGRGVILGLDWHAPLGARGCSAVANRMPC